MNNPSDAPDPGSPAPEDVSFPKNAVVGVVNTPEELVSLGGRLRDAGVDTQVYCTESAADRLQHAE